MYFVIVIFKFLSHYFLLILTKYYWDLVGFVSIKMNSNVYPLNNTNFHYLSLDITIMPLHNGKILLTFCKDNTADACLMWSCDIT